MKKEPSVTLTFIDRMEIAERTNDGSLRDAARHLNADYRNAVIVDDHTYHAVGWRELESGEKQEPAYPVGKMFDDRIVEKDPQGKVRYHKSVREALKKHR